MEVEAANACARCNCSELEAGLVEADGGGLEVGRDAAARQSSGGPFETAAEVGRCCWRTADSVVAVVEGDGGRRLGIGGVQVLAGVEGSPDGR